jgi:hypothetical protein
VTNNTSATGGVLTPAPNPTILNDDALDDLIAALVAAVTSVPTINVRPRFQNPPPPQPPAGTDWIALGESEFELDTYPEIRHTGSPQDGSSPGFDTLTDHEHFTYPIRFYGPNARGNLRVLCDGLRIPQNTEALLPYGIKYIDVSAPVRAPGLLAQQWVNRWDARFTFARVLQRVYQIEDLASAEIRLIDDSGHVNDCIKVNK